MKDWCMEHPWLTTFLVVFVTFLVAITVETFLQLLNNCLKVYAVTRRVACKDKEAK